MTPTSDTVLHRVMGLGPVTYRQLDYWTRQGRITPTVHHRNGQPAATSKSGFRRHYDREELRVLLRIGRLVRAGLKAEDAAVVARSMVDRDEDWATLPGGVTISVDLAGVEGWLEPVEVLIEEIEGVAV